MIDHFTYTISLGRTLYRCQLDLDLDLASSSHAFLGSGLCFLITQKLYIIAFTYKNAKYLIINFLFLFYRITLTTYLHPHFLFCIL